MKKNWFKILPAVLLAAAIALSPSFSAGQIAGGRVIEIRVEDILIIILGLVWMANFLISGRKKIEKPPLFLPILAWLGIGLFSVLTNWIFGNIGLSRGFFYFLKEVEFFFIYFYVFYHIKTVDCAKFIIKFWVFLGLVNVGWNIYQISRGLRQYGMYGPGAVGEIGSFPSGGFFLILFIFFINILLFYYFNLNISNFKKGILMIAMISPSMGVFSSASRTSFLGLVLGLCLTFLFYFLKRKKIKSFLIGILILIFVGTVYILLLQELPAAGRGLSLGGIMARVNVWESQILEASNHQLSIFFGLGKSVFLTTEESHNQYVRNFIETGIIGSLIFLVLIFAIIKRTWQGFSLGGNSLKTGLSVGLLVATLVMLFVSISNDAFIIVKVMETYWFFTAITMAVLSFSNRQQTTNNKQLTTDN